MYFYIFNKSKLFYKNKSFLSFCDIRNVYVIQRFKPYTLELAGQYYNNILSSCCDFLKSFLYFVV